VDTVACGVMAEFVTGAPLGPTVGTGPVDTVACGVMAEFVGTVTGVGVSGRVPHAAGTIRPVHINAPAARARHLCTACCLDWVFMTNSRVPVQFAWREFSPSITII
jgi:hypothetical protein